METQTKTISIKLHPETNERKRGFVNAVHKSVESVARDFLGYRMKQIQSRNKTDFYKTQKDKYKEYREQYPKLNSAILQDTLRWVDERVFAHIQTCKKKHKLVRWPNIKKFPIILRNQLFRLAESETKHFTDWLTFCRTNIPLQVCDYHREILSKTEKFGGSQLIKKDGGQWFLQLTCHVKTEFVPASEDKKVLGVDLGIKNPIVCNDGKRIGNGKRITHKKKEFGKKRSKEQSSSKDEITNKQNRWMQDRNHFLSRRLIDHAVSQGTNVLVLEDLKGHHLSNRRYRKYTWAFSQLIEFIKYKAKVLGIKVVNVDPDYTSQTCSSCGQKSRDNRRTRDFYECGLCGARLETPTLMQPKTSLVFRLKMGHL